MSAPFIIVFLIQAIYFQVAPASALSPPVNHFTVERSRAFSLLFSCIQCISETDEATKEIREINKNYKIEDHLNEYLNKQDMEFLLQRTKLNEAHPEKITEPMVFSSDSIAELKLIVAALYPIADNWSLFYKTSAWLLGRVNGVRLHWSLGLIAGEKFKDTVVVPTATEMFPQLYFNKNEIFAVAGLATEEEAVEEDPLQYFLGDPRLHEFHTNWHIDNPFIWIETKGYPDRDRKGELFLFMHRQLIARYNAELISNGLPLVTTLELQPGYVIPGSYKPDIVNVNYKKFPVRREGTQMKEYDDGKALANLRTYHDRLSEGIEKGFLVRTDGIPEFLWSGDNGTSILGVTMGDYNPKINSSYYGMLHNFMHRLIAGTYIGLGPTSGVTAHPETTIRETVFFNLHKELDDLYYQLKTHMPAYTALDLHYEGIEITEVGIQTNNHIAPNPTLTTYMDYELFEITTAARPCRGVGEAPEFSRVKILHYSPFNYSISIQSKRQTKAYGMIRIFLLPVADAVGVQLEVEESHRNSILLDIFHVELKPLEKKSILRSSLESSVTRMPVPGIKALYNATSASHDLLQDKRACGFPNNLLIPKGTESGIRFKLFVMISEEDEPEEKELPHYPYCGMLNGLKYPDKRSMGFPFDRPGTKFTTFQGQDSALETGGHLYGNAKTIPIFIQHIQHN